MVYIIPIIDCDWIASDRVLFNLIGIEYAQLTSYKHRINKILHNIFSSSVMRNLNTIIVDCSIQMRVKQFCFDLQLGLTVWRIDHVREHYYDYLVRKKANDI